MNGGLLFATLLLAFPTASMGQSYERNGLPCVANLCIGDGLEELSALEFDRAVQVASSRLIADLPVSPNHLKRLASEYHGDIDAAAPYLAYYAFDSVALQSLGKLQARCSTIGELKGSYTTSSGIKTSVAIALVPRPTSTAEHRWTVVTINQIFPDRVLSKEQAKSISAELNSRYKAFVSQNKRPVPGSARVRLHPKSISLQYFGGSPDRSLQHPLCLGSAKLGID